MTQIHKSRGRIEFDESCPDAFKDLVTETLEESTYIHTVSTDDDVVVVTEHIVPEETHE